MEAENIQAETQKFTDAQIILQYIYGGKSTFTLQSIASGERFTYKVSKSAKRPGDSRPSVFFVSVLTGPDNAENYNFVGTIFERKTFKFSPKGGFSTESPSIKAFVWAFGNFVQGIAPEKLEFWPSTHCARCGRPLTVPASVHDGFGPECITKVGMVAGNGHAPIVGTQKPISFGPAAPAPADDKVSDNDARRMVNALRNHAPENFMMDGEMETVQQATNFWFKRFKKQPMSAAELAEKEQSCLKN